VPHDPRPEWGLAPETPLVLLVSRYLETKRVEDFIAAAALLTRRWPEGAPLPFFAIVGDGPEPLKQFYEQQIATAGPGVPVRLVGGRHDLPNILPHAAVGVVSSELEGCPNTILEFLAAGVPIAATNIAPIAAIVRHGTHALLAPPRAPAQLAAHIETLLQDRPLAQRLAAAGREIIGAYDWQATIRHYEAIYTRILS
jgi:glycosyltransferase involved in cell wall biosynthesis